MADDEGDKRTFLEKLLFYTTAFFVLLGIFSLFSFLFLVPFVIDPAFTTIFMEFEPLPVLCQTLDAETYHGLSNCSWASCREGCTREVFECTQIRVSYKLVSVEEKSDESKAETDEGSMGSMKERRSISGVENYPNGSSIFQRFSRKDVVLNDGSHRSVRAIRDYDYIDKESAKEMMYDGDLSAPDPTGLMGNDSEWYFIGAKLFPNVKGCGYPPMLNCTIWLKMYQNPGTNYSCYYSKIDPGIVITELDMKQVYLNLILSMAIPIPSFIASVIYLTIAYFKIYNDEEQEVLVNEEVVEGDVGTPVPALTSGGGITPGSEAFREDLASFGHQLKVAMADEMSRESIVDAGPVATNTSNNSLSGLPPVIPVLSANVNKYPGPDLNPAPPPQPQLEKATRPNALELKLGAFV